MQDELAAEAEEKLSGDLDAKSEWYLSASGVSAESDMGSASGNPSSHIKQPTFSGGNLRDSGRALSFLEDITSYFEVLKFFSPESESDAWLRRCALLRMTSFPDVVIYMHTMHAWLTVQMLWQMHARTLQAVHMLFVCMGIFSSVSPPLSGDCTGSCT